MQRWLRMAVVVGIFLASMNTYAAQLGDKAGIVLESTRVIYPGSATKGITFTVTNRTEQTYLLQSRVVPWAAMQSESALAAATPAPFIVVPPLTRFNPDEALTLRIRLTKHDLPKDRESVFGLSLKAIPSQSAPGRASEAEAGAKMVLALQNNLKLFYRPTELMVMSDEARAEALQFTLHGTQLRVYNPTPYYITLSEVITDNQTVELGDQRMLAPFSTVDFDAPVSSSTALSWRIIDDDGRSTPRQSQSLH
ncbi:TPA: molecular chaperone [Providencia rettgeri]|uniref:fimbrial biogenesis chaperone n=1 Tax=Providencia TaxID=586 RepID=UPI00293FB32A|nr:molecular chaperone [Providencia rettgeri]